MSLIAHWEPDPDEWKAVTDAIKHERDLSGIPYPPEALAYSALQALANRDRGAVEALEAVRREGKVCANYELCDHVACQSSYAAWAIADAYLRGGQ